MPRQPHPAHHIDLEHPGPVIILDIEEGFRLVDSEIVDENIDLGELRDQPGAALGAAEIEDGRMNFRNWRRLFDPGDRVGDRRRFPPVDDDFSAHSRKPDGGGEPDAPGRAGDKPKFSSQIEIHG